MTTRKIINRKVTFSYPKHLLATAELIADAKDIRLQAFMLEILEKGVEWNRHVLGGKAPGGLGLPPGADLPPDPPAWSADPPAGGDSPRANPDV